MMESDEQGQNEKRTTDVDTEVGLEKLVEGLTIEHQEAIQNMATSIDMGYSDFEAEKWCKLIYFPSPMTPKRNLSRKVMWWICMENYESSLDTQTFDARCLEVDRCVYKNCGCTC